MNENVPASPERWTIDPFSLSGSVESLVRENRRLLLQVKEQTEQLRAAEEEIALLKIQIQDMDNNL